jgi:hypothetical protein
LDSFKFRDDYTATKLLSKAAFLNTSFDKKDVAMKKFFEFEELCSQTNSRFEYPRLDDLYSSSNDRLLTIARCKIREVLGSIDGDWICDEANWGPGITTKLKGSRVSAINKFHLENGITRDLHALVCPIFFKAYPLWGKHLTHLYGSEKCFSFEVGNRVVTVPKSSKTDRVIAVEPGINLWFQKGIGSVIRKKLLRVGIDLNDQSRNQRAAHASSKDGRAATVDFSSASDSISVAVVRDLLPDYWFRLLDSCRSQYGILETGPHRWNKFSSMGNGFTFELESLIFFAAAYAVCKELKLSTSSISVFGDDVIIDSRALDLFSDFCRYLGFIVNPKKSFSSGYFRESCGAYFWSGIDCKPVYLRDRLKSVFSVYRLANAVRLLSRRRVVLGCDRVFLPCWRLLYRSIPKLLQLRVDLSLGDVGFICNFDEAVPRRAKRGFAGYRVTTLTEVGLTDSLDSLAVLLARLRSPSISESNNTYTLRGRTKWRLTTSLVMQWCNLGPWY